MAMRKLAMVLAVSAAMASAGCSMLGRAAFKEPVVTLKTVNLRGVGLTGGSLDVTLAVENPNHFRLDATRLTYKVMMGGDSITVASGALDKLFSVQEGATSDVTIPVDFTYAGLGAAGRSLLNTGADANHVMGDVTVGSPIGNFTVPYSSTGRFTTTGAAR
jgi:LEA14-like dessication related protein